MRLVGQMRPSPSIRAVTAAVTLLLSGGCTDFSTTPESLGRVIVKVTDREGAGLSGIGVDLLNNRLIRWRFVETGENGSGEFDTENGGVIPQTYIVRVLLSGEDYVIAVDDTNDKRVSVVVGETHNVTFKLARRVVGPPGP